MAVVYGIGLGLPWHREACAVCMPQMRTIPVIRICGHGSRKKVPRGFAVPVEHHKSGPGIDMAHDGTSHRPRNDIPKLILLN